mgnify:CR=1 FL=1
MENLIEAQNSQTKVGRKDIKPSFSIQWHITTSCDQRCKYCYLFNSPDAKKEILGMVTREDVLEELVGEIADESDGRKRGELYE